MRKIERLKAILKYLPQTVTSALLNLDESQADGLCEIRLRAENPVVLIFTDKTAFITSSGRMTPFYSNGLLKTDGECVKEIFNLMCRYSVYSLTEDISNGFITLQNGCRVGVYGTAVTADGRITAVRNIRGLNIRLSGFFEGISEPIAKLYEKQRVNTLICGPPSSGKTTVLKDLCRFLSDNYKYKIAVIDERAEFSGEHLGCNTDVLTGYPKPSGITIAVRTLSPDIIICDELGEKSEVESVLSGLNSGVSFVMSIHCHTKDELLRKEQFNLLRKSLMLDYCVFLKNKGQISEIKRMKELFDEIGRTCDGRDSICAPRSIHRLYV